MTDQAEATNPHGEGTNRLVGVLYATLEGLRHTPNAEEHLSEETITHRTTGPTVTHSTLGQLIDALDERAFGLMLLILALPCCIPFLWGIPQIVSLPMLAIAAQLAMGRESPWLPRKLEQRKFEIDGMKGTVEKAERYLGWLERLAARRLTVLTDGMGARIVGALMLIPTASILVPLPGTNTAPGIGVAIASVGLLERDGLLVLLGLLIGLAWVGMLVFFGAEAVSLIKDWVFGLIGIGGAA